jgi:hypothetical protein
MTTDSAAARLQRKRQLIAEGAVHRAGLALTRRQLQSEWQAGAAGNTLLRLFASGTALKAVMPLLAGGLAALVRKPRLRRLAGSAAVAAAVATAVRFLLRKRR